MGLVLVHGIVSSQGKASLRDAGVRRTNAMAEHGAALGVHDYEWVDGRNRKLANGLLRRVRGTAVAVDAVEILELDEAALRASLASDGGRELWRNTMACAADGFDATRSFILAGSPILLREGSADGQRVLWFGNGLEHLSQAEFIEHYTGHHGPLVAGHAEVIGLKSYRQVPLDQTAYCESLRELGLGQASPPAVFAELVMGAFPVNLPNLRARRAANREIEKDEKRHINFSRSMLLLT